METWVGLARNGLCIIQDLQDLVPIVKFTAAPLGLFSMLPKVTLVGAFIAPLQAAAVLFNVYGGIMQLSIGATLHACKGKWGSLLEVTTADNLPSSSMAKAQFVADRSSFGKKIATSMCLFAISNGFFWLCLNTLKQNEFMFFNDLVNWGLIGMEVALLILLCFMSSGVTKRFSNAKLAENIAFVIASDSDESDSYLEKVDFSGLVVIAAALEVDAPTTPWPTDAAEYLLSAYTKELGKFRKNILKETKTKAAKQRSVIALRTYAYSERINGCFEAVLVLLNVAAFIGYAIFPITYLLSDETV